ncbi:hypothetical protein PLESTB_000334800 [Pleodorina starrii]|uniref:Uncharacterized protein n=1 Tax=Pleodorina starrii TaxID=330485 RepID=A0A9W6BDY6_9CHLO|nr:hypothetical protein PLESTB_000334800 [Pleodorina starrii]
MRLRRWRGLLGGGGGGGDGGGGGGGSGGGGGGGGSAGGVGGGSGVGVGSSVGGGGSGGGSGGGGSGGIGGIGGGGGSIFEYFDVVGCSNAQQRALAQPQSPPTISGHQRRLGRSGAIAGGLAGTPAARVQTAAREERMDM